MDKCNTLLYPVDIGALKRETYLILFQVIMTVSRFEAIGRRLLRHSDFENLGSEFQNLNLIFKLLSFSICN